MKKILVFSNEFPPDVGGAGVVAEQFACALSSNGYDVTVLTRKRAGMIEDGAYKIKAVSVFWKFWFLSYRKAVNFDSFDLIILNDPAAVYVAGRSFSSKAFSKSVIFLHGSEPEFIYEKPSFTLILSRYKKVYTSALKRCHRICAVSNYMKGLFISRTGMIELQNKIFVNYAGVDLQRFFPEKNNNVRINWHIPEDAVLLLSTGRVIKEKGYYDMFCLFNELCEEGENLYWIIVGEGEYLETLKTLTMESSHSNRILFTGPKRREELRTFYSNADVFWLLSYRESESFGLVYIEAQACGTPAIGLNRAGITEAISNGMSGFLVNNAEQVKPVIKNRLYKNLVGSDITDFSRKFQIENIVNTFMESVRNYE